MALSGEVYESPPAPLSLHAAHACADENDGDNVGGRVNYDAVWMRGRWRRWNRMWIGMGIVIRREKVVCNH